MISLDFDPQALKEVKSLLRNIPNGANRARQLAVNKTLPQIKTVSSRKISDVLELPLKRVNKDRADRPRYYIKKATVLDSTAYSQYGDEGIPIDYFEHSQVKSGVSVLIKKGRGRKIIEHAFIATVRKGTAGEKKSVWIRKKYITSNTGAKGRKLARLYTTRMTDIYFDNIDYVVFESSKRLNKELEQAASYIFQKVNS